MPWELTLADCGDPAPASWDGVDQARLRPLGTVAEVRRWVESVCPSVEWTEEPSFAEVLRGAGAVPDEDWAARARTRGYWQGAGFSLEFSGLYAGLPVRSLSIDVRGQGDPLPVLRALCGPRRLAAFEWSTGRPCVDLGVAGPSTERGAAPDPAGR